LNYLCKEGSKVEFLSNYLELMFDIVIPLGPNDISCIKDQLNYTKQNIIGYRHIYLISYDPSIIIDGCITIDEKSFPFTKDSIAKYHTSLHRNGWYLQQLLKLYAGSVIPGILDTYLVIDSDTFFLRPTVFIKDNKCLYNFGREHHIPYFNHMKRLHSSLHKVLPTQSGICHHMIFQQKYIQELIELIETVHQKPFWIVFLEQVEDSQRSGSGASEYELYFNFMLIYHPDMIQLRELQWANVRKLDTTIHADYISYHHYSRQ
jgi:hypothetical protein